MRLNNQTEQEILSQKYPKYDYFETISEPIKNMYSKICHTAAKRIAHSNLEYYSQANNFDPKEFVLKATKISVLELEKILKQNYFLHQPPSQRAIIGYYNEIIGEETKEIKELGIFEKNKVIMKWGYFGPIMKHDIKKIPKYMGTSAIFLPI